MNLDTLIEMTILKGDGWAISHTQRILKLIDQIAGDLPFDRHALTIAAYLHDWGAFPCYAQPGASHPVISRQIAEQEILPQMELTPQQVEIILEAIELHDYRSAPPRSVEALLLREADCLDLLGATGLAREFTWGPKDLSKVVRRIRSRIENIPPSLTLPAAKQIAAERAQRMQKIVEQLLEETGGML